MCTPQPVRKNLLAISFVAIAAFACGLHGRLCFVYNHLYCLGIANICWFASPFPRSQQMFAHMSVSKAKQSTGSRCNLLATKAIKTMFFSAPFATASNLQEALANQLCDIQVTLMTSDCIRPNMLDNYSKTL